MSLRFQISVRILLISLFILLLGGSISIWQARKAVSKEVDSSINLALQLIKIGIGTNKVNTTDWMYELNSLDQTRHLTIQFKQPSGEIINITDNSKSLIKDETPPNWFINLVVSENLKKVEHQIDTYNNKTMTLIIQANPIDEIAEAWNEAIVFFSELLLLILLTFLSLQLVFSKTLFAIKLIVEHLKEIETGEYKNKLPDFQIQEYADIAKAINHMTDVLDSTQQQNRTLTQHSLKIQEEERLYLSQELHDEFGQSLTAIKTMAVTATHDKTDIHKITVSISDICDHLMIVVRSMMKQLHPLILAELGLKAALEDMVYHWQKINSSTSFNLYCDDNFDTLDQSILIQIYRVIQEGMTNIIRHAHAEHVTISLKFKTAQKTLFIDISDDGKGFKINHMESGFGLLGMQERIKLLGGDFKLQSKINEGTQINIQIPLI